ncbi:hypothetical protein TC_0337 [Chlamydia muridarum str. Nigg]|uniref:Uncharacterized protein n=1 Tax=Chlamydia muridarum (strain MoPn / Nigg) TaxID=243161 RepID=Q9PKX3_CHLMU|nr:hypothetical protein TC_0337 [Chlamydia muridarum str. Nigg]AHH22728.1 hypothetical protein TAC_01775 [Chlamydia muridarum str. Nigg3 CMUT3-5]AHH23653.1 hypothetical protein Y015_01775 [Chlamydia muridarum str. Nigg CM972]
MQTNLENNLKHFIFFCPNQKISKMRLRKKQKPL